MEEVKKGDKVEANIVNNSMFGVVRGKVTIVKKNFIQIRATEVCRKFSTAWENFSITASAAKTAIVKIY